eukprot:CAMPEP_0178424376 /NCGR_PEP_ID=MMETSP0689_2-20121128/28177_1 /TAXON_ID=160604 /ORGANISM="Amphidinium massartii, Strain CS-259" /LENGTH=562 /DNA_ID=CAMNT_0020046009 /DNA_START=10 /DNA_END=1695 /DNA_ORIENTATION=-
MATTLPISRSTERKLTSGSSAVAYFSDALPAPQAASYSKVMSKLDKPTVTASAAPPAATTASSSRVRALRQMVAAPGQIGSQVEGFYGLGTGGRRMPMETYEAKRILEGVRFYREWDASVQERVPMVVSYTKYPAGTTLFLEDDPPGNCYFIMAGKVAVLKRQGDAIRELSASLKLAADEHSDGATRRTPDGMAPSPSEDATAARGVAGGGVSSNPSATQDHDASGISPGPSDAVPLGKRRPTIQRTAAVVQQLLAARPAERCGCASRSKSVEPPRPQLDMSASSSSSSSFPGKQVSRKRAWSVDRWHQTKLLRVAEGGQNFISRGEDLGTAIDAVGPGTVLGELSLLKGQPRTCTVVCAEDCEFLVFHRVEFDSMLKNDMRRMQEEKQKFLMRHVPGLRDVSAAAANSRLHALQLFTRSFYPSGHRFLTQGQTAKEETIYVIANGRVEFTHLPIKKDVGDKFPTKEESISKQYAMRSTRVMHACAPSLRRQNVGAYVPVFTVSETQAKSLSVLVSGALFGSLPFAHPEPFTVQATKPCEVYAVFSSSVGKLPTSFYEHMRE